MGYSLGSDEFNYNTLFVMGTSRSGKSLFSKLVGSCSNIEWIFEPVMIDVGIRCYDTDNLLNKRIGISFLRAACRGVIHDRVLLRNASFRPNDMSSIYNQCTVVNIIHRLEHLKNTEDVNRYIQENSISFLIDIPDLLWHIGVVKQAYPESKIIHVVRNGYDVVREVVEKGWYSIDRLMRREDNYMLYYSYSLDGTEYYLPWWLPKDKAVEFINGTDVVRAALYWILSEACAINLSQVDMTIKYEELVENPEAILDKTSRIVGLNKTFLTSKIVSEIYTRGDSGKIDLGLSEEDEYVFTKLMRRYNYEF